MTTYNNLYGDFVSDENIKLAVINSSVQKRNKTNVKEKLGAIYYIRYCRQMLSYLGWISHTDTYNVYLRYIKPYVNISAMKKKIGKYDKKRLEDKKNGMDRS